MATTVASLRILLGLDSKDVKDGAGSVKSELKGIQTEAKKTQSTLSEMKKGAAQGLGIGAGLGAFSVADRAISTVVEGLNASVTAASNLNETLSKSNVVFGASAQAVNEWGKTAADSIGLSQQAAVEAAASFGNLFGGMGLAQDQSAAMSQEIVKLAGDLASFNNLTGGTDEAIQKLRSGLVGEAEPLRSVGVLINEAAVSAKALELGFTKTNGAFTEGQKVQARYALILEQTKTAQGDAARTGDQLAGSQRRADAAMQNAMATIGQGLLPVVTELSHGTKDILAPALVLVGEHMNEIVKIAAILGAALVTQAAVGFTQTALAALRLSLAVTPLPASVLAAGTAFTAAGAEATGLAVGMNSASLAAKGLIPVLGLVAVAIEGINKPEVTKYIDDLHASMRSWKDDLPPTAAEAAALADSEKILTDAGYNLDGSLDESTRSLRLIGQSYDALHQPIEQATASTVAFGVVTTSAGLTILAARQATDDAASSFVEFGAASIDSAAGLTTFAANLGTAADEANGATAETKAFQAALDALPNSVTVTIRLKTIAEGAGGRNVEEKGAAASDAALGLDTVGPTNEQWRQDQIDRANEIAADRKAAADKAAADDKRRRDKAIADAKRDAAEAKRIADELARSQVAAANDAFDRMADAAHRYFDDLHKQNLKAIDDAQKAADAQIEAQKRANLQPATAAEARLHAVQQARQLASLQADLAAAKTPEERLRAQQALSDFQAQARIDFLRKQADDANAILDEQKKTQDQGFQDQRDAANKRNQDQVNLFDENLKSLREYVAKHPKEWKKATDGVSAVLKAAGVDYEKAGKDNADAYIRGVQKGFTGFGTPAAPGKTSAKGPAGAGTTPSPAIAATAGLVYVGGGVKGDVYLDGNKVGEFIERYLAANASATTSGYTARHN